RSGDGRRPVTSATASRKATAATPPEWTSVPSISHSTVVAGGGLRVTSALTLTPRFPSRRGGLSPVSSMVRYLSEFAKDRQVAAGNASVPPSRSLVSRTRIARSASPTSTQSRLPPVKVATRQEATSTQLP